MLAGQQRALSVRRPWANLIIAGQKTVESRAWEPAGRRPRPDRIRRAGDLPERLSGGGSAGRGATWCSALQPG